MKKDIAFKVIIVTLSCALAFSIYFNFKSPYLPENKEDHLGKITYNLPADCKWIYGDFDSHKMNSFSGKNGGYLFEPETNKVFAKAYVDMNTLSELTIGYNNAEQKLLEKDLVEWSGNHGNVPDCIENLIIASNNSDEVDTYSLNILQMDDVAFSNRELKEKEVWRTITIISRGAGMRSVLR